MRRCGLLILIAKAVLAQDLAPRAYVITPAGSNAFTVSFNWNDGNIVFDPSVPITDSTGRFQTSVASYYHSFSFFGRSANLLLSAPYATGTFSGIVNGTRAQVHPSGLADARARFSVNLRGGPALRRGDFATWREKSLIGFSFTAILPIGQNDPARLVNIGTNRWAFKPEIGLTRRWQRVVVEGYSGIWLYTQNPHFYPGDTTRLQRPILALEAHAGYYVRPRLWISLDGNFWTGGRSSLNGVSRQDTQKASRAGVTISIPFTQHQSMKFSYSRGAFTRIGGNFQTISTAWQYSWFGKPRWLPLY